MSENERAERSVKRQSEKRLFCQLRGELVFFFIVSSRILYVLSLSIGFVVVVVAYGIAKMEIDLSIHPFTPTAIAMGMAVLKRTGWITVFFLFVLKIEFIFGDGNVNRKTM